MPLIITVLLLLLTCFSIKCQDATFEYLLSTSRNEVVQDVVELSTGEIFLCGFISKPNEFMGKSGGLVFKIDNKGHFLDSIIFYNPNRRIVIDRLLQDSNNMIVCSGYSSDTVREFIGHKNSRLELKRINDQLVLIDSSSFDLPTNYEY